MSDSGIPPIGAAIRAYREESGMTLAQLAGKVYGDEARRSHLFVLEKGEKMPRIDTLHRLAVVFGVQEEDFFTRARRIAAGKEEGVSVP